MCWKSFVAALAALFLVACGDNQPALTEPQGQPPAPIPAMPEWTLEETIFVLKMLENRVVKLEVQQEERSSNRWNATDHSHSELHDHNSRSPYGTRDHTHPNDHTHSGW